MILMLPAFAFLWFYGERRSPASWIPIVVLQLALAFDVPVRLSHAAPGLGWARLAIEHFDRLVVLGTLLGVSVLWYRMTATRTT